MTLKSDAKFEEKLTLDSKNEMRNLVNFNLSNGKSESLHYDMLRLSIAYKVSAKKSIEELSPMTLKSDPNFEEKLTFYLNNDMRNLLNFKVISGKFDFDGLLLSKVHNG